MITIVIPGFDTLHLEHLVMDYNGTLAIDGDRIKGTRTRLISLGEKLKIHVITADTFGKAKESMKGIPCTLIILKKNKQQERKSSYIRKLGVKKVVAIGNGMNDALMLKDAALGIAVIQKEGASSRAVIHADILCHSVLEALDLLNNPLRVIATLRN